MGKTKQNSNEKNKSFRSVPLTEQLSAESSVKQSNRVKKDKRKEEYKFVDEKLAEKILRQIEDQRDELPDANQKRKFLHERSQKVDSGSESDDDVDQPSDVDDDEFKEDDQDAMLAEFDAALSQANGDKLLQNMKEKQREIETQMMDVGDVADFNREPIDPKLKQLYSKVGTVLSKYRSGKLPKAFKLIHKLKDWEEFLELTNPEQWSAAAMREATKIFVSNFKPVQAVRFLRTYLLPRVRDDMIAYKCLNPHLFTAITHALFKPRAFFDGFLIPLCESGKLTNREALIISGALKKVSIKMLFSAGALLELMELPYSNTTMLIMQALLKKKYALPVVVIQTMANYFLRFIDGKMNMTVIWYQGLLTFVELCRNNIDEKQKNGILSLIKIHHHHELSDAIQHALCGEQN